MRAAVQVAAGNRRPVVRARATVHAVVRGDVTLHSHVRLSTRGAVLALGSRQGEHEASVAFELRGDREAIVDKRRPTWG